jgi:photosystem II stability/assembly factor-like uncharacterized protein
MKKIIIILYIYVFNFAGFSQWVEQNPRISSVIFNSIAFSNQTNGIIVGSKGIILHTSNAGENWDSIYSPTNMGLEKVFFIDDLNGWIAGDSGLVLKTTTGGSDWIELTNNINEKLYSVYFESILLGWAVGKNIVYRTSDGGLSWQEKKRDTAWYYDLYFADQNNGWVVGDSLAYGVILRTSDGGDSWIKIFETYFGYLSSIKFASQNIGYSAGENSIVAKTSDGGLTWSDIVVISQGNYDWQEVYFVDDNIGWLVDLFGAVIKTTDGGLTWTEQIPRFIIPSNYYSVYFLDSLKGWVVGAGEDPNLYGRIIRTINGGVTSLEDENAVVTDFKLFQNYPNPFNPSTMISYSIPQSSFVTLKVYDVLGNEVATLVNETKSAGKYDINFNAAGLSNGVYFYTIKTDNFTSTKKMLLMK